MKMITKAIVEELLDGGKQARVRIPFYDKVQGAADATATQDLSIASTSIIPGCYPVYNVNDIVFVAFEDDSISKPVIIGLLYANDNINSTCDINAQSLIATVNSQLPEDTTFIQNDTNKVTGNSGSNNISGGSGDSSASDAALAELSTQLSQHISDTNNPHSVTGEQVGSEPALTNHISNTNNPHSVTKSQIGLGNVDNLSKSQMTGSISSGNTGFVTGGDVYDTIIGAINASY